jgi:DNA-binding MarR family transcriptional regulator
MNVKREDQMAIKDLTEEIDQISKIVKFDSLILLMYAAEAANRFLESRLKKHGQDQTRLNILYLLISNGGQMTPTNISKRVYRSKHAITRAIDILEKGDLVRRGPTDSDRRSITITITRAGIELVKNSLPDMQRASSVATSCLSGKQIDDLREISKKLRKWLWTSMPEFS